jgi:hypothetical protein
MQIKRALRWLGLAIGIGGATPGCALFENLMRIERCRIPGGVLGGWHDVEFMSFEDSGRSWFFPQERLGRPFHYRYTAPAYDERTSTLYCVDQKLLAIVRWPSGSPEPKPVCVTEHLPWTPWLVANPSGTALCFTWAPAPDEAQNLVVCETGTGRTRVVVEDVDVSQRPAWVDDEHVLVLAHQDGQHERAAMAIQKVNMQTGKSTTLLSPLPRCGTLFALSPSRRRIFVATDSRCRLYDFPSLLLLKELPDGLLRYPDDNLWVWPFCLVDDSHLVYGRRRPTGLLRDFPLSFLARYTEAGTGVVDLDTLCTWKLSRSYLPIHIQYLPLRPDWRPGVRGPGAARP